MAPVMDSYREFLRGAYRFLHRPLYRWIQRGLVKKPNGRVETVNEIIDPSVVRKWLAQSTYRPPHLLEWERRTGRRVEDLPQQQRSLCGMFPNPKGLTDSLEVFYLSGQSADASPNMTRHPGTSTIPAPEGRGGASSHTSNPASPSGAVPPLMADAKRLKHAIRVIRWIAVVGLALAWGVLGIALAWVVWKPTQDARASARPLDSAAIAADRPIVGSGVPGLATLARAQRKTFELVGGTEAT